MKNDTTQNERRHEEIGDEAIYLRINQLQKGLFQFTDTTNAYRLLAEHGKDIRYNAPWKNGSSGTGNIGRWMTAI
jgi:putative DNA primase/helicase